MVNTPVTDPERALALSYAPGAARDGMAALFALDDQLAGVVRTTRDPMVGQLRLTWWHEALAALDTAPPPAQAVVTETDAPAPTAAPAVTAATS